VQVEHNPKAVNAAPFDKAVDQRDTGRLQRALFVHHDTRIDRETDMVHALSRDPGDVVLRDEAVTELCPKQRCPLRTDEVAYQRLDLPG
jgi:hypothetical protein